MKFNKQLTKVVQLSDPEWAPFWVNYKSLKKKIRELTDLSSKRPTQAECSTLLNSTAPAVSTEQDFAVAHDLSQKAGEVTYFRTLTFEVQKASDFYRDMEAQMQARRNRIRLGIRYLKQPNTVLEDDAWIKMRRACLAFYKDLLLLENYAVINYCACSKALKKHDKIAGIETRGRFMRNVVNRQPFTHYSKLAGMLQEMEQTFREIDALQGESTRPLEEEERLFVEAIRGLNKEASTLQREEKADLAVSPPPTEETFPPDAESKSGTLCIREWSQMKKDAEAEAIPDDTKPADSRSPHEDKRDRHPGTSMPKRQRAH